MGSTKAPAPDTSSPPPPPDSDSSTSPPPEKSSPPPPSSPPPSDSSPPPPKTSPPPPEKSSPPPAKQSPPPSPPTKTPPTPENSSPPPSNASPPPSSPFPPPTPAKKIPPTPIIPETPPAPESVVTNSPPPPAEGGAEKPPAPAGDLIKSPPGMPFVPPPPALPSNQSASSGSPPPPSGGSSVPGAAIAGAIVGGLVIFILFVCLWMFCKRKKKTQEYYNKVWNTPSPDYKHHAINIPRGLVGMPSPVGAHLPPKSPAPGAEGGYSPYYRSPGRQSPVPISPDRGGFSNQNHLPYDDVVSATDGFANANMLGQGGFGLVHKGVLPGGKQVAVKSLKSGSGQGEREFQAEVDIISRVHHRHLVSLVGYCIAADKRLLVYEFVPNNTLEYHLHKGKSPLDFPTRVRIALGSAKGLAYLHEDCHPRIIHRDIKAANILLDYNFEAQVADFGLARLYNDTNTHVSTRVMGTFGYLAPEYASSGKLTDKSDVFSFGVVLLELITGRHPVDPNDQSMEDCSLVDWARPLLAKALAEGHYDELVDPRLERNYNVQDMESMVACAAASIRHSGKRRPRMSQIMRTLEGDMSLEGLDGTRTGQGAQSNTDYDTATYNADLKKFRQMAFGTQTFGGGSTTSEYGLNPSASSSNVTSPRDSANLSL